MATCSADRQTLQVSISREQGLQVKWATLGNSSGDGEERNKSGKGGREKGEAEMRIALGAFFNYLVLWREEDVI